MSFEQLQLFAPTGNGRRPMAKAMCGLAKEIAPGPERLLAELVKRGLDRRHLHRAAALVLALDKPRPSNGDGHDADDQVGGKEKG